MHVNEILERITHKRALVVGDICLDRWCLYDPSLAEPSRETGIPRVAVIGFEATPGAGGTVANNLVAMGVKQVSVLGVQGDDGSAYELGKALAARRIDSMWMVTDPSSQTFTYTKYLNVTTSNEDLSRTDFVNVRNFSAEIERKVIKNLRAAAVQYDVILVSDQAETEQGGVVTAGVREALAELAVELPDAVFWVDSRMRGELFRNVIVKMNDVESGGACQRIGCGPDLEQLRQHVQAPVLLVTHGADGVEVIHGNGRQQVQTQAIDEPVDICGAGDSFSAGAAMALQVSRDPVLAARFGNAVASVTIMKKGTGTASPDEIKLAAGRVVA
ncbi:MAG: PfkB family carbohydrate kinase [Bryobacterales bacterium]|jgi:rfaE bifunctional protein kinase chain/domain|nr:PfkB family carbohydrate kinase [Bryobacterales bacterium]